MSVRVVLVDDDALVRSALRLILGGVDDLEVVGEAADGDAGVATARELRPDVVLMDVRMPGVDGLTATERLLTGGGADAHRPAVIVLTTFDTDEHVLQALRVGAAGFLVKDTPPPQLVDAVRSAAAGTPALSPSVLRLLIAKATEQSPDDRARATVASLTERERDILAGVGSGASNADIGAHLHLSPATVKAHVSRLLTKLGLEGRVQLAVLAHDADLTEK